MDAEEKELWNQLNQKLDKVSETLGRMEQRQIRTTAMVEDVEKQEQSQTVGSFGTVDPGEKKDG